MSHNLQLESGFHLGERLELVSGIFQWRRAVARAGQRGNSRNKGAEV